ncbi:MAG: hypothetical protein HLUCCO07_11780 [Rhodobacteraceae bacterium HLUCCO07]|nr:MAG: hypothetical protein HLUCCO07_11780 [Rhodobacteraceae bacterium HLUCCO07]
MSDQEPITDETVNVGLLAKSRDTLPRGRTVLIGIFGDQESPGALLRSSSGQVQRVKLGDDALGGKVMAIGDGAIVIASGQGTKVLKLP